MTILRISMIHYELKVINFLQPLTCIKAETITLRNPQWQSINYKFFIRTKDDKS